MLNHRFDKELKAIGKVYCSYCGLIKLNNRFTLWAIKHGCDHENHPDYNRIRKEYTGYEYRRSNKEV